MHWMYCFLEHHQSIYHILLPGPIKCFDASSHQILAKKCLPKRVIATRLISRQKCVNSVKIVWMWTMNNNLGPSTGLPCLFFLPAYIWGLASSFWGGTFEAHWGSTFEEAHLSRILECLRRKFEDFTHKKSITRQINQIHCFKGAHLTLSQIQFEGAHLRILQCNPKNAKSLHLPDLRQKRVCYQSNVPPQTAMCLHPWVPWL